VACEFSGIVRDAFIAAGHDAVSCDLLPSERPGPHIVGDVWTICGRLGLDGGAPAVHLPRGVRRSVVRRAPQRAAGRVWSSCWR
jgi:hypothetical protein